MIMTNQNHDTLTQIIKDAARNLQHLTDEDLRRLRTIMKQSSSGSSPELAQVIVLDEYCRKEVK
jgi:hypothetical protein